MAKDGVEDDWEWEPKAGTGPSILEETPNGTDVLGAIPEGTMTEYTRPGHTPHHRRAKRLHVPRRAR